MNVKIKHKPSLWNITYDKQLRANKLMQLTVNYILTLTKTRTLSGKNINKQRFAPYSKLYVKSKGSTRVNLKYTGAMINSMVATVRNSIGRVYVKRNADIGQYHNEGSGNLPKRLWFGISLYMHRLIFNKWSKKVNFTKG